MLQGLNLPFVDLSVPENGLHLAVAGSAVEAGTGASFSDILRRAPDRLAVPLAPGGTPLPSAGKELPGGDAALPPAEELLNFAWAGTLPAVPLAEAPRFAGSPAIESMLQGSRLAAASPTGGTTAGPLGAAFGGNVASELEGDVSAAGRSTLQLTLPAGEPGGRQLPVLPPALAGRGVDVTPLASTLATTPPTPPQSMPPASLSQATAAVPLARTASGERIGKQLPDVLPRGPSAAQPALSDMPDRVSRAAATLAQPLPGLADDQRIELQSGVPPTPLPVANAQLAPGSGDAADEAMLTQLVQLQSASASPVTARSGVESAAPPPALPAIATPVQDPAWGDRLGERLMMLADSKTQVAEIRLTPAELGPLRVRISLDDGAASVTFHAQHAVTRDALEQALPRLRELFADSGLTLEDSQFADPGEQGVAQGKPEQRDAGSRAAGSANEADAAAATDAASRDAGARPRREQLLDTFA